MTKKLLKEIIREDKKIYFGDFCFKNIIRYLIGFRFMRIGKYIILLRKVNYYEENFNNIWNKILCFYYKKRKNKLGEKLNLEIDAKK